MVVGENSLTADRSALKDAQSRWGIDSHEDIIRDTGWWFDERAFKWKYELSDKDVDFEPLGFVAYPEYLPDYIKHDKLFESYPQLASIRLEFDTLENEGGHYSTEDRSIILDNTGDYQDLKEALIHEIQHVIQQIEGFELGTSLITTRMYLFSECYEKVKDSADFRNLKSPDEKYEYILRSFTKDDAEYQEKAVDLYYKNEGEIEAYETLDRIDMNETELREYTRNKPDISQPKLNFTVIKNRYVDIMKKLGYNDTEIRKIAYQEDSKNVNKQTDGIKSKISILLRERLSEKTYARTNVSRYATQDGSRRNGSGGRISGRQVSLGRADGRTNKTSTQEYADIKYFLGDDTDTMPAVDFKARAENIIRLADMLQDGAKNDAEYAALSKVKNNAENIVQKYGELAKLKAELKDVSFAQGPRDTARIESLNAEINSIHRSLNSLESGLASTQAASPFRDMMQRKIQSSTSKVRREYYDRQKQRTQSRKNTETRNKIKRQIQKPSSLFNNPTKEKNVKIDMQEFAYRSVFFRHAIFHYLYCFCI